MFLSILQSAIAQQGHQKAQQKLEDFSAQFTEQQLSEWKLKSSDAETDAVPASVVESSSRLHVLV
jgi:hypothetical protein